MTLESDLAAIGAIRASFDANLDHEQPGTSQGRIQVSDVRSSLNGLRDDALLADALHCRRLTAYPLYRANAGDASVLANGQSCEVCEERLQLARPRLAAHLATLNHLLLVGHECQESNDE